MVVVVVVMVVVGCAVCKTARLNSDGGDVGHIGQGSRIITRAPGAGLGTTLHRVTVVVGDDIM